MSQRAFAEAANIEAEWAWKTARSPEEPCGAGVRARALDREDSDRLLGMCISAGTAERVGEENAEGHSWKAEGEMIGAIRGRWTLEHKPAPHDCRLYYKAAA